MKISKLIIGNMLVLALLLVVCDFLATGVYCARDSVKQYLWSRQESAGVALNRHDLADFEKEQPITATGNELQWTSYVYWRRAAVSGKYVNVDANGLRKTWMPPHLPERPIRIFMFGGSTIWGTGSRDDYTIPSQLSKILARQFGPRIEVVNYGETGYVNTQELIRLLEEIERGNVPEIAIFYDGYNDTFSAFQNGVAGIPLNETNRIREFNLLKSGPRFYLELARRSNLFTLLTNTAGYLRHARDREQWSRAFESRVSSTSSKLLIADLLNVYRNNTRILNAIGPEYNARIFTFWQPSVFTKVELTTDEKGAADEDPIFRRFYQQTITELEASPIEKMNSFHDLAGVFNGHAERIFVDYAHTSESGNEIVAGTIASEIAGTVNQLLQKQ